VVDTRERKEEFLRALAPVSNNPAVKIEIRAVDEATQPVSSGGRISVQQTEETVDTIAVDEELHAYFEKQHRAGSTDDEISKYSSRLVNNSYSALFQAIELKKLIGRFADVDMRAVAPDARAKWLAMLREHASAFERQTAQLRAEIQPVFFPGLTMSGAEEASIQNDAELARAVERLHKLALANNAAIRTALTISSQSSASAIKSRQFWNSLVSAEKLAARIKEYDI
jgi:hypothetical protein